MLLIMNCLDRTEIIMPFLLLFFVKVTRHSMTSELKRKLVCDTCGHIHSPMSSKTRTSSWWMADRFIFPRTGVRNRPATMAYLFKSCQVLSGRQGCRYDGKQNRSSVDQAGLYCMIDFDDSNNPIRSLGGTSGTRFTKSVSLSDWGGLVKAGAGEHGRGYAMSRIRLQTFILHFFFYACMQTLQWCFSLMFWLYILG